MSFTLTGFAFPNGFERGPLLVAGSVSSFSSLLASDCREEVEGGGSSGVGRSADLGCKFRRGLEPEGGPLVWLDCSERRQESKKALFDYMFRSTYSNNLFFS